MMSSDINKSIVILLIQFHGSGVIISGQTCYHMRAQALRPADSAPTGRNKLFAAAVLVEKDRLEPLTPLILINLNLH